MAKKQDDTIYLIIGIVLVVALFYISQIPQETIGLTPHYYKDGVEVFPQSLFSIVNGESFDQISFDISATNLEIPISNMKIVDAFPLVFKDALPTTIQSLASQETKILWTSGLMNTAQFETMIQPVNFWVEVTGGGSSKEFSIDLNIDEEPPPETVQFRTSSLIYGPTTHIGYTDTCGNNLVEYDATSETRGTGPCDISNPYLKTFLLDIPGHIEAVSYVGTDATLFLGQYYPLAICDKSSSGEYFLRHMTPDPAGEVDISKFTINLDYEVVC